MRLKKNRGYAIEKTGVGYVIEKNMGGGGVWPSYVFFRYIKGQWPWRRGGVMRLKKKKKTGGVCDWKKYGGGVRPSYAFFRYKEGQP